MSVPVCKKKSLHALFPAIASLATIAVESLSSFLDAIRCDQSLAWNSLRQLENDFLLYGKFNITKLQDIVRTVNSLRNKTLSIEKVITGQDMHTLQVAHLVSHVAGRITFVHKVNLYVHSVLERQIRLYEWLLRHLQDLLDSIGILSTGRLPPLLFLPLLLHNVTQKAIAMVRDRHPDYDLAINHITEYYDMNLATFGIDDGGHMIVAFPVFVKDHTSKPKILYEIETVKVPIPDKNDQVDSYSEVTYSKPYMAISKDYYIQLHIQEL